MYLILAVYRGGLPMRVVCKSINLGALRLGAGSRLIHCRLMGLVVNDNS